MRGVSSLIVGVRPLAMREALGGGAVARGAVAGACRGGLLAAGGAPAGLLGMRPAVMAWKSGLGERAHYVDGRKKRVHDLTLRGVTRTDPTEFGKEAMKRLRKDKATDYIPGRYVEPATTPSCMVPACGSRPPLHRSILSPCLHRTCARRSPPLPPPARCPAPFRHNLTVAEQACVLSADAAPRLLPSAECRTPPVPASIASSRGRLWT